MTRASTGREWEHLYFIFERKCAVRLPGHFAGLFAGHIYVWELTLLLILLPCTSHSHLLSTPASASAERPLYLVECAVRAFAFASDV